MVVIPGGIGDPSMLQAPALPPPEPRGNQAAPGAGPTTELHVVSAPALSALAVARLDAQLLPADGRLAPWVPRMANRRCLNNLCILGWVAAKRGSQSWIELSCLIVGV